MQNISIPLLDVRVPRRRRKSDRIVPMGANRPELEGLLYNPEGEDQLLETKNGVPLYGGSHAHFETWKFKIEGKFMALESYNDEDEKKKKKKRSFVADRVMDGLHGEALKIAMELGLETLNKEDGCAKLIAAIDASIRATREDEAIDLYNAGIALDGPLTRQPTEPIAAYISRRTRWWTRVQLLDKSLQVGEHILADNLLKCAGLSDLQQNMVKSSVANVMRFDTISSGLRKQFGRLHEKEKRFQKKESSDKPRFGFRAQWRRNSNMRPGFKRRAFMADVPEEEECDDSEEEADPLLCQSCGPDTDFQGL